MTASLYDRIERAAQHLRARGFGSPRGAFFLGAEFAGALTLERSVAIDCASIPEFPRESVAPARVLEFGVLEDVPLLLVRGGDVSASEGAPLADGTFAVRVAKALGAAWILLANGAAAIGPSFEAGDLVFVTDHLNWIGDNPLIGPNDDRLGPRFPDLSRAYSARLLAVAEGAAHAAGIATRRGVFAAVAGPGLGTPAELRLLRLAGADLVGTSTVPDVLVAVHGGLEVLGLCVVTSLAFPENDAASSNDRAAQNAAGAVPRLETLVRGFLRAKG